MKKLLLILSSAVLLSIPFVSYAALGDILYGSSNPAINTRLPIGNNTNCLIVQSGVPAWSSSCGSGSGGSGGGPWATTTSPYGGVTIYPIDTSNGIVVIGDTSTSSPNTVAYFDPVSGQFAVFPKGIFSPVNPGQVIYDFANSQINRNNGNLFADLSISQFYDGTSISSPDIDISNGLAFPQMTGASLLGTRNSPINGTVFNATDGTDYWSPISLANVSQLADDAGYINLGSLSATSPINYDNTTGVFSCPTCGSGSSGFSTTSTDYWLTQNRGNTFSTTSADAYINASSTIAHPGGLGSNSFNGGLIQWNGSRWVAVSTTTLGLGGIGSGVTSVSQTYGTSQTGAITLATSSASTFSGLTISNAITNSSATFTFAPPTITGTLNVSGGGTGDSTLSSGQLLYGAGTGAVQTVATGTLAATGPLTVTAGQSVIGSGATVACTTAASGVAGCLSNTAFDTFNNKQSTISATWPITLSGSTVGFNGLSTSSAAVLGNIPYFTGVNTFGNVATSSLSVTGPITFSGTLGSQIGGVGGSFGCTVATAALPGCLATADWSRFDNKVSSTSLSGASVISYTGVTGVITTIGGTFGAGNYVFPSQLTVSASTTLQNFTATNATTTSATSTNLATTNLCISGDCRSVWPSFSGGVWPFTTTDTNYGVPVQSTSTPEWFKLGLFASSTSQIAYASTTAISANTVYAANFIDTSFSGNNCVGESSGVIGQATNCVSSLASAGGTLTISSPTGNVDASVNTAHANIWTASTTFANGLNSITSTSTSATSTNSFVTNLTATNASTTLASIGGVNVTPYNHASFTYATSTWTGTTTIPIEVGYGDTWLTLACFTDAGTLNVDTYFNSTHANMLAASSTVGVQTYTSNNTMTFGSKVKVDLGTPASSPTKVTCTVKKQENNNL